MIDKVTRGYRILEGLDLTYEFRAHVVRDGQIVGMLTEPAEGRPVEFRDRAKVCCIIVTKHHPLIQC
jgi:hypothetical protein